MLQPREKKETPVDKALKLIEKLEEIGMTEEEIGRIFKANLIKREPGQKIE